MDGAVVRMDIARAPGRGRAHGREVRAGLPLTQDRRMAHRGVGANHAGEGIAPRFASKAHGVPLGLRPPVDADPGGIVPVGDSGFVARPYPVPGLLGALAPGVEEPVHRGGVIHHATRQTHDLGRTVPRPDLSAEPIGFRTAF